MRHPAARRVLSFACLLGTLAAGATAQSGPGLPKLVYDPGELFQVVARIGTGNHGHSMLHEGYLAVAKSDIGVDFYDLSNPYAPVLVKSLTGLGMDLCEPHTMAQTTAWGGSHVVLARGPGGLGGNGITIWDWSDVLTPRRRSVFTIPNVPGGYAAGVFWFAAQAPYVYVPIGSLGLVVIDATNPQQPVIVKTLSKSQTGGFNAVVAMAVGNMLILTNSDSGSGFSKLDISDPVNPRLVSAMPSTPIPYGANVNDGRLLLAAVSGCVSCPNGGNGFLQVFDIDQEGFTLVNRVNLAARGGSVIVQDGFAQVGASNAYSKIDVRNDAAYTIVGTVVNPDLVNGGDWDWVTPLGNLVAVADDEGFGTSIVPHSALPDEIGPSVTMVVPPDGATNQGLETRVGITVTDMIELDSIDATSFIVRPAGGAALAGSYTHQFGIVNFAPVEPLQPNTTYEVVVPAGGMKDWSGNPAPETFVSRFSTGAALSAIVVAARRNAPAEPGELVTFDVTSVSGPGPFTYSWDFGDGSPRTPFSSSSQATYAYADVGHYAALVTVAGGTLSGSDSFLQTVHYPLTAERPTRSSTIALDESRGLVWCVNADDDTVSAIDAQSFQKVLEAPVGARPRTLARAPDGTIWVVCEEEATVRVLDGANGAALGTIVLPYASAPFGIAMRPDGGAAYVTLRARGELAELDPATRTLRGTTPVGPEPKGIAIAADSERIFVTRFISSADPSPLSLGGAKAGKPLVQPTPTGAHSSGPAGAVPVPGLEPVGEVYELSAASFALVRTLPLALDPGPDTEASGRGLPNYLSSLAISPDGRRLWVPSKKDNIQRGQFRNGRSLTFESTVRTIVSQIDLAANHEDRVARVDFNNHDMAFAVEFTPLGDYAFHALQGSNALDVRDAYSQDLAAGNDGTGLAPQGLALSADGSRLFVHNFMSRTIAVYDASGVTDSTTFALPLLASVPTVASELLSPQILRGKQLFYDASDPRMNEDGYLSCASCHLDGGQDGRTWDFTDRGEGLRNTSSLVGKRGMGHGNVHWTANFDEIQDFENDIRAHFGGDGFMSNALFQSGTVSLPLGSPKAGLSADLDALAAYVSSLTEFGRSPHREPDGMLSPAGVRGRLLFQQLACAQCHAGADFTDSASGVLHDVGTISPSSGQASGAPLVGLDTPTLRGLWATAPYLHDGSARTLLDVLTTKNAQGLHGATGALLPQEQADLVQYLLQIDDLELGP
jgi:DNA-binding beta-propeller fold protein YncE/cytochrome c peroxidase